jgi:hypothetical protein
MSRALPKLALFRHVAMSDLGPLCAPERTWKPIRNDPEQFKRFIDAAHEAGADETEAGANRAFKKNASKTYSESFVARWRIRPRTAIRISSALSGE